jgi:ferrous iron transport protein A
MQEVVAATLATVSPGSTATVKRLSGEPRLKRRLMDMGITPGVAIKVVKVAPLGDPLEVTVRGYELSLRKDEAAHIEVTA